VYYLNVSSTNRELIVMVETQGAQPGEELGSVHY
jgi:hypothetical protein